MALAIQNGALRLEGNALGTGQACCCVSGNECCCVGDSNISIDENAQPTGNVCLGIEEVPVGECESGGIERPLSPRACSSATIVVEWCGQYSATISCAGSQFDVDSQADIFNPLCIDPDGVEINGQTLAISFDDFFMQQQLNVFLNFSECDGGCFTACNRCVIRAAVLVDEGPSLGASRSRFFYLTYREGCDDPYILEPVYDQGFFCCPDDPEVTITIAP